MMAIFVKSKIKKNHSHFNASQNYILWSIKLYLIIDLFSQCEI